MNMNRLKTLLSLSALLAIAPSSTLFADDVDISKLVEIDRSELDRSLNGGVVSYAESLSGVRKAVVSVYSTKYVRSGRVDPFFRYFFGDGAVPDQKPQPMQGMGSGVIVSGNGYILTNNHVVEGADEVKVQLTDDEEYVARVVGTDPQTDIAVLKIEGKDLPVAKLADSDAIEVGDVTFAIGNPLGVGKTVTMGIVSATGRGGLNMIRGGYENFIQTDAAINRGNSGGALVDAKGRLIGINTMIITDGRTTGNIGIGFAVPVNLAYHVMEGLVESGSVARGFLGVGIQDLDKDWMDLLKVEEARGALVNQITPGTPAEKAGIMLEDLIVEVDGLPVQSASDLRFKIAGKRPGESVTVVVIRDGERKVFEVELASRDAFDQGGPALSGGTLLEGIKAEALTDELRKKFELDDSVQGIVVTEVEPGSKYAQELPVGLVVLKVNREKVTSVREAREALNLKGKNMLLIAFRGVYRYVTLDFEE